MRRRWRAAALALACLLLLPFASARAAETILQLGARAGYVFGLGWTVGPALGLSVGGEPYQFLTARHIAFVGGLSVAGDVVLGEGEPIFRVHVDPEVGAVRACPPLAGNLSGGIGWVFRREASARFVFEGGASFLGAVYSTQLGTTSLFTGASVGYAEALGGGGNAQVGADIRMLSLPNNHSLGAFLNLCPALGKDQPKNFLP
jgi:hypothetical protein